MGKINKYSNLYDKNGKIIRKVNDNGILKNVTIPELEELIDKYDGNKNDRELDNMKMMLFRMYNTYGNPHEQELIDRIKAESAKKTSTEEIKEKLEELDKDVSEEKTDEFEYIEDAEYVKPGDGILAQAKRDYIINYDPEQHEANLQKYINNIQVA